MAYRVALLSSQFPPSGGGGTNSAHYQIFHNLAKLPSIELKVYTFQDTLFNSSVSTIERYGSPSWIKKLFKLLNRLLFWPEIHGRKSGHFVDILQSICGIWKLNRSLLLFAPNIIIAPDHGAPLFWLRLPKKTKVILISHHIPERFLRKFPKNHYSTLDIHLATFFERKALRKVNHVICPSEYMKTEFQRIHGLTHPCQVIPHPVFANTAEKPMKDDDLPVLYIPGAGNHLKGSDYLIPILTVLDRTLPKTQKVKIYISGSIENSAREKLLALSDRFFFDLPGPLAYPAHLERVSHAQICLSLSLIESYGMAAVEAIAVGCDFIAFKVDALPEVQNWFKSVPTWISPNDLESAGAVIADKLLTTKKSAEEKNLLQIELNQLNLFSENQWEKALDRLYSSK